MSTVRTIVLALAVGAVATWLWMSRGVGPLADSMADGENIATKTQAPPASLGNRPSTPDVHAGDGVLEAARPAASVIPPPVDATTDSRNDATYGRMLAATASFPRSGHMARRITEIHERFVQAPDDDPEWARRTEQALRDFFRARSASDLVTSISCRSDLCEVQGEVERPPVDVQLAIDVAADADPAHVERAAREPVAALREEWPLGRSLKMEAGISWPAGDRIGVIQLYRRMDLQPKVTSP